MNNLFYSPRDANVVVEKSVRSFTITCFRATVEIVVASLLSELSFLGKPDTADEETLKPQTSRNYFQINIQSS